MSDQLKGGVNSVDEKQSDVQSNKLLGIGAQAVQAGADASKLAADVAHEALDRGASLAEDVKNQTISAAEQQKDGVAAQLGEVVSALHASGEEFKAHDQEWIAEIVERGAGELGNLAAALRTNDLRGLMGKLEDLARGHPAIFVGTAMAAGFAAVRVGAIAVRGASPANQANGPASATPDARSTSAAVASARGTAAPASAFNNASEVPREPGIQ